MLINAGSALQTSCVSSVEEELAGLIAPPNLIRDGPKPVCLKPVDQPNRGGSWAAARDVGRLKARDEHGVIAKASYLDQR